MAEQAPHTIAAQKTLNDAMVTQLRSELDELLEYQANDAPSWVSLEGAEYPEREGSLKDFMAARQMFTESEMLEEKDDDIELDDEISDDEIEGDKMQVGVQADVKLGMGGASILPESTAAVAEKEEHGDERVIAEKLHNLTLDQEIQEASLRPRRSPRRSRVRRRRR